MQKVILVRFGEIALKGQNRSSFEAKLVSNIKHNLFGLGKIEIIRSQGRIYIEPAEPDYPFDEAVRRIQKVFGVVSLSIARKVESDLQAIKDMALELMRELRGEKPFNTFKVETKRGNKRFPMESPEVSAEIGGYLLENVPGLEVDVHNPDVTVFIEIRESSYVYADKIQADGGMPVGTNGRATLLISGGIDSPVAGWMIAKRGVEINAVHFYSYPYTSERAKEKVVDLVRILTTYCGEIHLFVVPFTEIQLEIQEKCPEEQLTIIMRRFMMKIAERIAKKTGSLALVTGESIGQVASQTVESLTVTNQAVSMPVFRPLIGMDKNEIIEIARKINTFETSILPYEDCCTVFLPRHPNTKPKLEKILASEQALDMEGLIDRAVSGVEKIIVKSGKIIKTIPPKTGSGK